MQMSDKSCYTHFFSVTAIAIINIDSCNYSYKICYCNCNQTVEKLTYTLQVINCTDLQLLPNKPLIHNQGCSAGQRLKFFYQIRWWKAQTAVEKFFQSKSDQFRSETDEVTDINSGVHFLTFNQSIDQKSKFSDQIREQKVLTVIEKKFRPISIGVRRSCQNLRSCSTLFTTPAAIIEARGVSRSCS